MSSPQNDNFQVRADKPIDSRNMDFAGGISTPFASTAAAISAISSAYRHQYLTVWILAANGDPIEYWWRADTTDGSLEPKNKESYTLNADGSITLIAPYNYEDIVVIPTNNISNLKIGTTSGAGDLEPGVAINAGVAYKLSSTLGYINSNTSIFFTGITTGTKVIVYKKW